MAKFLEHFMKDDAGAITVEWVVLTAGVVGLVISAGSIVETQTVQLAADVGATVEAWDVTTPSAVVDE